MELEIWQVVLIGLVASVVIQALKLIAAKFGVVFSRAVIGWISAGVALALAVIFKWGELPPLSGDPMELINALAVYLGIVVGWATLIYNIVFEKILGGIGLSVKRFLEKAEARKYSGPPKGRG